MKNFLILIILIFISSCSKTQENKQEIKKAAIEQPTIELEKPYSNPFLVYGSSFGNYFQVLYRQADFDKMVNFTHSSSIKKHGYVAIKKRYEHMKFNFNIKLGSHKKINDSTYLLNYTSNVIATRNVLRLDVGIENDSAKVILPEKLEDFPE